MQTIFFLDHFIVELLQMIVSFIINNWTSSHWYHTSSSPAFHQHFLDLFSQLGIFSLLISDFSLVSFSLLLHNLHSLHHHFRLLSRIFPLRLFHPLLHSWQTVSHSGHIFFKQNISLPLCEKVSLNPIKALPHFIQFKFLFLISTNQSFRVLQVGDIDWSDTLRWSRGLILNQTFHWIVLLLIDLLRFLNLVDQLSLRINPREVRMGMLGKGFITLRMMLMVRHHHIHIIFMGVVVFMRSFQGIT